MRTHVCIGSPTVTHNTALLWTRFLHVEVHASLAFWKGWVTEQYRTI
jgi:hypothetical protein